MLARRPAARRPRGQVLILGAVTLLLLALIVFITFNLTVTTHEKIAVQNYSDLKAFSMAVQEARALNYFAYTNRAIAASYVAMANLHAYMSEAAMLGDLKMGASEIMDQIAAEENDECYCCCTPFGCGPCCFTHCIHAFEAGINSMGLMLDWITGKMGSKIKKLDGPAHNLMSALNLHIEAIHLSQTGVQLAIGAMLAQGTLGNLNQDNLQQASGQTTDLTSVFTALNLQQWKQAFYTDSQKKKQLMAEVVNGSRQPFGWNRTSVGSDLILFPEPWVADLVKASLWIGPKGNWIITQTPDMGLNAGGRTGFTSGNFPNEMMSGMVVMAKDAPNNANGETVNSYDWGTLEGQWRDGAGMSQMPLMGPAGAGELISGNGWKHNFDLGLLDFFNKVHQGSAHDQKLNMDRFVEFNVGTKFPFNQPYVYAAASTDARVTESGIRGPWEVAKDGSGKLTFSSGSQSASIQLSDKNKALGVSKAMVYYHRLGDWSDYPNLFNPFWRAKLQPLTKAELATVVAPIDADAAQIAGALGATSKDMAAAVGLQP